MLRLSDPLECNLGTGTKDTNKCYVVNNLKSIAIIWSRVDIVRKSLKISMKYIYFIYNIKQILQDHIFMYTIKETKNVDR